MLKNYFNTAFRNFWRNKAFSIINILGLALGISAALVIFLIVCYEYSYDRFEPGKERIYRVVLDAKFSGVEGHSAAIPAPLGAAIEREVPGVELTVPVFQFQGDATAKVTIINKEKNGLKPVVFKKQVDIIFTDPQYFSLLPRQWIAGSQHAALLSPFTVVLTESRARQYFASAPVTDIIGRQVSYNNDFTATVTGVVKDLDAQSSFNAVEFISFATIAQTHLQSQFMMDEWKDWMAYSQLYIKLANGRSAEQVEAQLKMLLKKYNKEANRDAANTMAFRLQPLSDVHFNSFYSGIGQRVAHRPTLYGLVAIATFLLLLGCINFVNLTTANASQRAKEIGIRKTMGSSRKQLMLQFLGETCFITAIAAVLSVLVTPVLLRAFADFIPPGLHFSFLGQPYVWLFLLLIVCFISFISGLYPALILSGYKPAIALKNQVVANRSETRQGWVRKSLTVSQFVIAQFFIIATIMVSKQISFSLNSDLGFNKDGILTFQTPRDTVVSHSQQLKNAINAIPEVEVASNGFFSPADAGAAFTNISYAPKPDVKPQVQIRWGDPNYFKVYGLKLLAGRNVLPSDTMREFIINSTYAKLLGFQQPKDALGKQLSFNGKSMPIIGVMEDFHDQSTRGPVMPLVFAGGNGNFFHVKLKPNIAGGAVWRTAIAKIGKAYHGIYPEEEFNYKFYDDTIASLYGSEQRTAKLLTWATALAVFISCLGLLGLVIYTTNTRTKEIGIRKVLGASVANIVSVLSTDFVRLVCLAFLIAAPLAWWVIYKWLQDYAYKTAMSWWVFVVSGAFMLLVAMVTLSLQTIKSAMANPAKSLRTE